MVRVRWNDAGIEQTERRSRPQPQRALVDEACAPLRYRLVSPGTNSTVLSGDLFGRTTQDQSKREAETHHGELGHLESNEGAHAACRAVRPDPQPRIVVG